jgi:hypothetical protein
MFVLAIVINHTPLIHIKFFAEELSVFEQCARFGDKWHWPKNKSGRHPKVPPTECEN